MRRNFTRLLLLCALAIAECAWGFSQKEQTKLLQNADYRETWNQYQELFDRAKSGMSREDFLVFEKRENEWLYSDEHDSEARKAMSDGLSRTDAYASVLAMRIDDAESLLDRAEVIRTSDGVSGLYLMKNGALTGELIVRLPEEGAYAVEITLTNSGEPAGYFEGSAKLNGKTLDATGDLLVEEYDPEKDSAAVTLTFDSAGASAATTEKFKRDSHGKKWLDTNVVFDGRYVRQKSAFETR